MIEHPSRVSPSNMKLWYDEKYLHDYAGDFLANCKDGEVLDKVLLMVVVNLKKP
jgi:hypothetical protein